MKTHRLPTVVLVSATFLLISDVSHSRPLPCHTPAQLMKESDLVVIATATSTKDAVGAPIDYPGWVKLAGVNTSFTIRAVIKGDHKGHELTVLHYRLAEEPWHALHVIVNGPCLVTFRTGGLQYRSSNSTYESALPTEYLLYLKERKDGRYEPVTGPIDPEFSVRELVSPGLLPHLHDLFPN
jgi:hypothetical protein